MAKRRAGAERWHGRRPIKPVDADGRRIKRGPPPRRVPPGTDSGPVLAPLAVLLLLALGTLESTRSSPSAAVAQGITGIGCAVVIGWPALYAIVRSFRAGPLARTLRSSVIVLSPVFVALVLSALAAGNRDADWPDIAAIVWWGLQLKATPLAWILAEDDYGEWWKW